MCLWVESSWNLDGKSRVGRPWRLNVAVLVFIWSDGLVIVPTIVYYLGD
jgi:hypothetical protein